MISSRHGMVAGPKTKLNFAAWGSPADPAVILLPGWPQTLHAWRRVGPLLADAGYQAIALDLPGMGDSDFLEDGQSYDADFVAGVVAENIRALGHERVHVVSHDVGAWIAFSLAVRHSGLVATLTMMETQLLGISSPPDVTQPLKSFQFFFNSVPGLAEVLTKGREREYLNWLFDHRAKRREAISDADLDEYVRSYGDPARMSAGFAYYRAVPKNIGQHGPVIGIQVPTLILGAEHGVGRTFEESMRGRIASLQGEVLAGFGHYVLEECPDLVADAILRFLKAQSSQTAVHAGVTA